MISPELLRRFSIFGGLPPKVFEDMAQFCEEVQLSDDAYLFEQGEAANEVFLLLGGQVDLLIDMDENGENREEVETLVAGQLIGWSAVIKGDNYQLSAATQGPTHLIVMDAEKFRAYMADNTEVGYTAMLHVARLIGERLTNMRMRLMSFVA